MKTITFECETITPMFLSGADGTTPELRPPSIKGAMRFWWRAMNGHLDLKTLKEREGEIFGGTDEKSGRSKIVVFYPSITKQQDIKISTTPHHRNGYCSENKLNCNYRNGKCMKSIQREAKLYDFEIKFSYDENIINESDFIKLVKVTFLLGGIGKRSRRGFGSVRVKSHFDNLQSYQTFINTISIHSSIIDYPFIKNIDIGKKYNSFQELLIKIGESSHNFSHSSLGYASRQGRLSSPIYLSVIQVGTSDFYPIITELKTFEKDKTTIQQSNFKQAIL